jgi:hypothetical protein
MAREFPSQDYKIGQVGTNRGLRECADSGLNQGEINGPSWAAGGDVPEFACSYAVE